MMSLWRGEGCGPVCAASGSDAVDTIAATAPDLVFLDVEMPGMGGFDVVSAVGAQMPPVIFLTAYAQCAVPAFDTLQRSITC